MKRKFLDSNFFKHIVGIYRTAFGILFPFYILWGPLALADHFKDTNFLYLYFVNAVIIFKLVGNYFDKKEIERQEAENKRKYWYQNRT